MSPTAAMEEQIKVENQTPGVSGTMFLPNEPFCGNPGDVFDPIERIWTETTFKEEKFCSNKDD